LKIPLHLAERWGGISFKEAKKQWREIYRIFCRRGRGFMSSAHSFFQAEDLQSPQHFENSI
jgi:hypothetical protein